MYYVDFNNNNLVDIELQILMFRCKQNKTKYCPYMSPPLDIDIVRVGNHGDVVCVKLAGSGAEDW